PLTARAIEPQAVISSTGNTGCCSLIAASRASPSSPLVCGEKFMSCSTRSTELAASRGRTCFGSSQVNTSKPDCFNNRASETCTEPSSSTISTHCLRETSIEVLMCDALSRLFVMQGFSRTQPAGLPCRIESAEHRHQRHDRHRDQGRDGKQPPVEVFAQHSGDRQLHQQNQADQHGQRAEQQLFDDDLPVDVAGRGADRATQAELRNALCGVLPQHAEQSE